jgi:hypothetical protein
MTTMKMLEVMNKSQIHPLGKQNKINLNRIVI